MDATNKQTAPRDATTAPVMVPDRKVPKSYSWLASVHDRIQSEAERRGVTHSELALEWVLAGMEAERQARHP